MRLVTATRRHTEPLLRVRREPGHAGEGTNDALPVGLKAASDAAWRISIRRADWRGRVPTMVSRHRDTPPPYPPSDVA